MPVTRRGRLAPTPTGFLHVCHARTFAVAAERAGSAGLVMRIEDLDGPRCRPEYTAAALDDLRWLGLRWTEGPDVGGPHAPYVQSERTAWYLEIWRRLEAAGVIYPSPHSRRDVEEAATAPHDAPGARSLRDSGARSCRDSGARSLRDREMGDDDSTLTRFRRNRAPDGSLGDRDSGDRSLRDRDTQDDDSTLTRFRRNRAPEEPIFPPGLRPSRWERASAPGGVPWRFRVPDGRVIEFQDGLCGTVRRTAGVDFGDFVVWRRDDLAAYELAVVADDHAMEIAEVVRGADLLTSTARQILLYEALGWTAPAFAHAPLVCDASGQRLAKRSGGLAIRDLRAAGWTPADVLTRPLPAS
ncbi:MAG: glutamate--tRNA ligase family protein [Planctomycetota bacterium]